MRRKRLFVVLGCAAVLVTAGVAVWCLRWPKALYRVTFLPTMGGVEMWPHAINDSSRVAVTVRMPDGTVRVVLWDKSGRTEDLASFPRGSDVATVVLNNAGQVACTVCDPNRIWSSFFWDVDGRRYTLQEPDYNEVRISALNNRGQVVGHWDSPRFPVRAFLWDKTAGMQDLGTFDGTDSRACDLNDQGQIVGFFGEGNRDWRAFICDPNLRWQDLGPVKSGRNGTCRINNQGFVVGHFGSAESDLCISTWAVHTGPQQLPLRPAGPVWIAGLDETNHYILNGFYGGIPGRNRRFWVRRGSYLWESRRRILRLDERRCRLDDGYLGRGSRVFILGHDINNNGTILGTLVEVGRSSYGAVLLEPIE